MTPQNDLIFVGVMPVTGPQPTKADAELFAALVKTPEGRRVLSILSQGPGPQMGTWKIFKKIGGALKAVGKITRPFTTALAKTFLPSGVADALAKADPTTHSKLTELISQALPAAQAAFSQEPGVPAIVPSAAFPQSNLKRNLLIGGGVAVVVLGAVLLLRPKRSAAPVTV